MKTAAVFLPLDSRIGSRDRYGFWPIDATSFVAFVADAPNAAKVESGRLVEHHLAERVGGMEGRIRCFLQSNQGGGVKQFLADLATSSNDHLVAEGQGETYLTAIFVLVAHGKAHVIKVGDCAAYFCGNDQLLRFSETTRLGGSCHLGLLPKIPSAPDHYQEAVYMGAQPRIFTTADVETISIASYTHLALVTDGCEKQAGTDVLAQILVKREEFEDRKSHLEAILTKDPPVDDITAMILALPRETKAGAPPAEAPEEGGDPVDSDPSKVAAKPPINTQLCSLESQVDRISDRVNALETPKEPEKEKGPHVVEVPSEVSKRVRFLKGFLYLLLIACLTYFFVNLSLFWISKRIEWKEAPSAEKYPHPEEDLVD